MSFVVVAMLSIGAFTVNASNNTDKAVEVEKLALEEPQILYEGALHYRVGNSNTYLPTGLPNLDDCTFVNSGINYYRNYNSTPTQMYGWDANKSEYKPLYEITEIEE